MKNKCPYLKDNKECTIKRESNKKYRKLPLCAYDNEKKCVLWRKSPSDAENFVRMADRRIRELCEDNGEHGKKK